MKLLLGGVAFAALLMAGLPAWSQTSGTHSGTQSPSNEQNAPGTGGVSKPGMTGQPGNKSGPSVREPSDGSTAGSSGSSTSNTHLQDQSKVPGLPGGKSGPAAQDPGQGSSSKK